MVFGVHAKQRVGEGAKKRERTDFVLSEIPSSYVGFDCVRILPSLQR